MKRVKLTVAYDGTNYCGWQLQPTGITVEEVLNREISRLTGEAIRVIGASRTDSGVHALGNVAVFDTASPIPAQKMGIAINRSLPKDIRIRKSEEVPSDFHPRHTSCIKTYEYYVINSREVIPTLARTHLYVSWELDLERMRQGAEYLVGRHDFASFCNVHTNVEDTIREITKLEITKEGERITFHIEGTGFLYHMVRIIVGTLLRVGRGYYTPKQVREILEAKNRQAAGVTAGPQGLFLIGIRY